MVFSYKERPEVFTDVLKRFTYISFVFFFVIYGSRLSWSQESCVFLPKIENEREGEGFDRPQTFIKRKIHQTPQSIPVQEPSDFPNINITQYFLADQDEPSVAIDPTDPNIIVVGANDYRSFNSLWRYRSTDGGKTWDNAALIPATNLSFASDPAVVFNTNGEVFYSCGRVDNGGSPYPTNDVICYRSTDHGNDFGQPSRVFYDTTIFKSADTLADKYYIAIDKRTSSAFKGRMYVCWAEYVSGKSSIVLSYSSDNGATWSKSLHITGNDKYQCPIPTVNDNGDLFISYLNLNTSKQEIYVAKISNGGRVIASNVKVSNYKNLGPPYPALSSDPHPIIKGHLRVNSFPCIAAGDGSNVYITWAGKGDDEKQHIYFAKSTDGGAAWSQPTPIENDTASVATDKFFPWLAVDRSNGDVGVCFYDSRLDAPTNQKIDLFMAHSLDSGKTFAAKRISDVSFDPINASSADSIRATDTLSFFGDYLALDGLQGTWHPVWTDSRNGADQDLYTAAVNPRAPSSVTNFIVEEDSATNSGVLSWDYSATTTFGRPLGDFHFVIIRNDGESIMSLPSDSRKYYYPIVANEKDYTYTIYVVSSSDTSIRQTLKYSPLGNRKPRPPVIVDSRSEVDGLHISFVIPDRTINGTPLADINRMYFYIDGIAFDSVAVTDAQRGKTFERSFSLTPNTYHNIQLAASTNRDGIITHSEKTVPAWLYAGSALDTYSENFESGRNIFSPYSWEVTHTDLASNFLNDSLPNIKYDSGKNSWFLLPPVSITSAVNTLEFDHIALVAQGDSALIEFSTNNGLTFDLLKSYDKNSEPTKWHDALVSSIATTDSVALKYWKDKNVIIRFRLATHSSNGDGWFIDNIRFSDKLIVANEVNPKNLTASITTNPIIAGRSTKFEIHIEEQSRVTIKVFDMLGNVREVIYNGRILSEGEYLIEYRPEGSGAFYYEVISESVSRREAMRGRFIVIE